MEKVIGERKQSNYLYSFVNISFCVLLMGCVRYKFYGWIENFVVLF